MYTYPIRSNEIYHYGIKRRSGRYPWGSGKEPYQSLQNKDIKARVKKINKEKDISQAYLSKYLHTMNKIYLDKSKIYNQLEYSHVEDLLKKYGGVVETMSSEKVLRKLKGEMFYTKDYKYTNN